MPPRRPLHEWQHDEGLRAVSVGGASCDEAWASKDTSTRVSVLTVSREDTDGHRESDDQEQASYDNTQVRADMKASVNFQGSMMTLANDVLQDHCKEPRAGLKSRQLEMEMENAALFRYRVEKPLQSYSHHQLSQNSECRLALPEKVGARERFLHSPIPRKPVPIRNPSLKKEWTVQPGESMSDLGDFVPGTEDGMQPPESRLLF